MANCCAFPCHATLCCTLLCRAVPCRAMPCCAMPCCVVLNPELPVPTVHYWKRNIWIHSPLMPSSDITTPKPGSDFDMSVISFLHNLHNVYTILIWWLFWFDTQMLIIPFQTVVPWLVWKIYVWIKRRNLSRKNLFVNSHVPVLCTGREK